VFTKGLFLDLATVDFAGELDFTPIKEVILDWTFVELARDARKAPELANAGTGGFSRIDAGWRKRICLAEVGQ